MELLEVRELLAGGGEHDGDARHAPHGQGRAAPGVAVELGHDGAGESDSVLERVGRGDGVLADHRVDDEKHFVGIDGGPDVDGLAHHLFVDAEAPGGVDHHDVVPELLGPRQARSRHRYGVADAVARLGRPHVDPRLPADNLELVDRVGALEVGGDEQNLPVALGPQPPAELAGEGRLACALESGEHDDGRPAGKVELAGFAAEDFNELVVDDLDHLLAGVEGLRGDGPRRLFANCRGEGADDGQGDVGVEQSAAYLRDRLLDVGS